MVNCKLVFHFPIHRISFIMRVLVITAKNLLRCFFFNFSVYLFLIQAIVRFLCRASYAIFLFLESKIDVISLI